MSKKRTKKLSVGRMNFIAKTLREKYQAPCSVELVTWAWLMKREPQIRYVIYYPGNLTKYLSWNELEDAFAKILAKIEAKIEAKKGETL